MARTDRLIILAAGQGTRLRPLTEDRPKCLVELAGRPLLKWQIDAARACGIDDVVVVGGYRADQLNAFGVHVVENSNFAATNMVQSLFCASHLFEDGFILSYGDIVYSDAVLRAVRDANAEIGIVVDRDWRAYWDMRFENALDDAESLKVNTDGTLASIGQKVRSIEEIEAQYIGLMRFGPAGVDALRAAYARAEKDQGEGRRCFGRVDHLDRMYMTDLLQGMIDMGFGLQALSVRGCWLEIDNHKDLDIAERLVAQGRLDGRP